LSNKAISFYTQPQNTETYINVKNFIYQNNQKNKNEVSKMRTRIMLLSLLAISLFLVSCAPEEISDEEALVEELEGEKAIAGEAIEVPTGCRTYKYECEDQNDAIFVEVKGKSYQKEVCNKRKGIAIEFSCTDRGYVQYCWQTCEFGCDEAGLSCAEACTDSDGGQDIFTKGFTKGGPEDAGQWDTCVNSVLVEYYCDNGEAKKASSECPAGYECQDGACVEVVAPMQFCYYVDKNTGEQYTKYWEGSPSGYGHDNVVTEEGTFSPYCDGQNIVKYRCGVAGEGNIADEVVTNYDTYFIGGEDVSLAETTGVIEWCGDAGCNPETNECCQVISSESSCEGNVLVSTMTTDCGTTTVNQTDCSPGTCEMVGNNATCVAEEKFCYYLDSEGVQKPAGWRYFNFSYPRVYQGVITEAGIFDNYCNGDMYVHQYCFGGAYRESGLDIELKEYVGNCNTGCNPETVTCYPSPVNQTSNATDSSS